MKEMIEDIDYYLTKEGYVVLTEKYLSERGYCCGNGCRHCPYQYENVPEPRKSELLMQKSEERGGKNAGSFST